jgi:hypothetical protein
MHPLDPAVKQRIRTVAVISIVDLTHLTVATRFLPSEVTDKTFFGLAIDDTHFDATMRAEGVHLARDLQDRVVAELSRQGYEAKIIPTVRANAAPLDPSERVDYRAFLREKGVQADAVLDLRFVAQGYLGCTPGFSLDTRLGPNVNVSARLMDPNTNEPLYEEGLTYGCKAQAGIHQDPSLVADDGYMFTSYDALVKDPKVAAAGMQVGVEKIAALIGRALARQ